MNVVEICFHGRGGQGAVTAANILVAAALEDGNEGVQAFPFFGAERRGAPVRAFARISKEEILLRSEIYNPDLVIVLDESILGIVDVIGGLKKGGVVIINTRKSPSNFPFSKTFKVATVDATDIAIRHNLVVGGIPVVNTPILGAIPKVLNLVSLESIQKAIRKRWKGGLAERNVMATEEAYKSTEVSK
jgi:pyruvate ferredoxin oxidoreductase gamma subunit/2-oxoisovalerate ferredoxin oxidoreductase gamma subunit